MDFKSRFSGRIETVTRTGDTRNHASGEITVTSPSARKPKYGRRSSGRARRSRPENKTEFQNQFDACFSGNNSQPTSSALSYVDPNSQVPSSAASMHTASSYHHGYEQAYQQPAGYEQRLPQQPAAGGYYQPPYAPAQQPAPYGDFQQGGYAAAPAYHQHAAAPVRALPMKPTTHMLESQLDTPYKSYPTEAVLSRRQAGSVTYSEPTRTPSAPEPASFGMQQPRRASSSESSRRPPMNWPRQPASSRAPSAPAAPLSHNRPRVPVQLMSPAQRRRHLRGRGRRSPKRQPAEDKPKKPVAPPRPATLEYSRRPRKIKYKPYKLGDLRQMPKKVEMGPLQWRETEELMEKRDRTEKMRRYAERANDLNKQILQSRPRRERPAPRAAVSKFQRAKEYGRHVPKPRPSQEARRRYDDIRRMEEHAASHPAPTDLERFERQHDMDRDLVDQIKRDLQFHG